jgi:hypothetical protein
MPVSPIVTSNFGVGPNVFSPAVNDAAVRGCRRQSFRGLAQGWLPGWPPRQPPAPAPVLMWGPAPAHASVCPQRARDTAPLPDGPGVCSLHSYRRVDQVPDVPLAVARWMLPRTSMPRRRACWRPARAAARTEGRRQPRMVVQRPLLTREANLERRAAAVAALTDDDGANRVEQAVVCPRMDGLRPLHVVIVFQRRHLFPLGNGEMSVPAAHVRLGPQLGRPRSDVRDLPAMRGRAATRQTLTAAELGRPAADGGCSRRVCDR